MQGHKLYVHQRLLTFLHARPVSLHTGLMVGRMPDEECRNKLEHPRQTSSTLVSSNCTHNITHAQERSSIYDRLMEVENLARSAKRGIHSGKEPAANRINDMSTPGNAAKCVLWSLCAYL
jgi:hypothetical protein